MVSLLTANGNRVVCPKLAPPSGEGEHGECVKLVAGWRQMRLAMRNPDVMSWSRDQWEWVRSLAALLVVIAVTAVVTVAFWPGWMNNHTFGIILDAQHARFTDWHSAVLILLWRGLMLLGFRSPGWVLAGSVFTLLTGLYLVLRLYMPRPVALIAATLILVFPPILSFAIVLGTDAWLAASIVCGFGLVARCTRTRGWSRAVSAALAVVCAFLAAAARPTAAPAVLALMAALSAILLAPRLRGWWRWSAPAAGAALSTAAIAGSVLLIQTSIPGAVAAHPEQVTYDQDLIALSLLEHRVLFPSELYPRQDLAYLQKYGAVPGGVYSESLLWGWTAAIPVPVEGSRFARLQQAWLHAIRTHPEAYLDERLASALWQLGIEGDVPQVTYDPPPSYFGGPLVSARQQSRLSAYLTIGSRNERLAGWPEHASGPLQRPWMYVLVLAVVAIAATLGRRPTAIVLALLAWAVLAYTLEILLLSPEVTYRYTYPAVLSGTLLAVVLAARLWQPAVGYVRM